MKISVTISVFPGVQHPDGYTVDGKPEVITFNDDQLIEILRAYSKIPMGKQRCWQIESVKFK